MKLLKQALLFKYSNNDTLDRRHTQYIKVILCQRTIPPELLCPSDVDSCLCIPFEWHEASLMSQHRFSLARSNIFHKTPHHQPATDSF